MSTLVTGGFGFIGSTFINLFSSVIDGTIINIDKLTYAGNIRNLEDADVYNYVMDIADERVADILNEHKIETVINFAAETHVDRSIRYPKDFIMTDVVGLFNLVYNSMKSGVKKFIHISTDEVYGPMLSGEADESYKLNPTSPYAASKAAGELLLQSYVKTYNFPAMILRPCNNYGIRQYPEKLVPMAVTRLLEGKKVMVHGNGEEIREWISSYDCCAAIYELMEKGKVGEIYNIGSGHRMSNMSMISNIVRAVKGDHINVLDHVEFVANRPGNDYRYAVRNTKTRKEIGMHFGRTGMRETLKLLVNWYASHRMWWPDIDLKSNLYGNDNYLR